MHEVRLGNTDLVVSAMSYGTWSFGGDWGEFDRDDGRATIDHALDAGINLFDTAQAYGFGEAERFLGESLWRRVRRDEVVIATKGGLRMDGDHLVRDAGAGWLRRGVEDSLGNLGVDHIDLYQVHWPDHRTPAEETAGVLQELVQEGKIRYVGVSNYDVDQLDALRQHIRVDAVQPPYHLFRRDIEADLLPYCATHDIGVHVYGPLAHGLLAGAMTPDTTFPAGDWRGHSPDFTGEPFARNLLVVESLRELAELRGLSLVELAVAWTLSHPAVDVAIVGARHPAHLEESVRALDAKLTDDDRALIDRILTTAVPVRGPAPEGIAGPGQP